MTVHGRTSSSISAPGLEPMAFWLLSFCMCSTLITRICISPMIHLATVGIQNTGDISLSLDCQKIQKGRCASATLTALRCKIRLLSLSFYKVTNVANYCWLSCFCPGSFVRLQRPGLRHLRVTFFCVCSDLVFEAFEFFDIFRLVRTRCLETSVMEGLKGSW